MTEETPTPTPKAEPTEVEKYTPPASQADLDKIVETRLARERAKTADYKDLKEKADKFDKAQEASKTEIEKATERATKAEAEVAKARLEADRNAVALAKGLTPAQAKRLVGTTREELEADADELVADLKPGTIKAPPKPPGGSGASNGAKDADPDRELARRLFGGVPKT